MPLTTWTVKDEVLSDALDNYDRALGLTGELPIEDDEREPLSDVEAHMERALRTANWSKVQDWRDLRQEIGRPILTSEDRDDMHAATDTRRLVESRWRDGKACGVYIEQARMADAQADLLIEPEQWDRLAQVWVEHTDRLNQDPEEEGAPLPLTVPDHRSVVRYYAPAFLQGTKGVRSTTFIGVESHRVASHPGVRAALAAKAQRRRVKRPAKVTPGEWQHSPGVVLTSAPEFRGSGEPTARLYARLKGAYTSTTVKRRKTGKPAQRTIHQRLVTGRRMIDQAFTALNDTSVMARRERIHLQLDQLQVHAANLLVEQATPLVRAEDIDRTPVVRKPRTVEPARAPVRKLTQAERHTMAAAVAKDIQALI